MLAARDKRKKPPLFVFLVTEMLNRGPLEDQNDTVGAGLRICR